MWKQDLLGESSLSHSPLSLSRIGFWLFGFSDNGFAAFLCG